MKLSVVINTKNSEKYLKQCLSSVKKIADEIVIVDMASTDKTCKIASKFTDKIYQYPNPDIGYADPAREFAFAKAAGDWIFMIDSDEEIKPELAALIRDVVESKACTVEQAEAYFIARSNIIFDKAIEQSGWYPDYQLRLWQKDAIKWQAVVHSVPKIIGKSGYFPYEPQEMAIVHHNYQTVKQFVERSNKYTTFEAEAKFKELSQEKMKPQELWSSFFNEFWRRLFLQEGILEGNHGIALGILQASNELQAHAKIWEAQGFPWQNFSDQDLWSLRKSWQKEANYWWADLKVKKTIGIKKLYWRMRRKFAI